VKVALSCDHRGNGVCEAMVDHLHRQGYEMVDVPRCEQGNCDYPDMAWGVARAVTEGRAERGILICGSGIGMSIAANKVDGIRAALVHDDISAEMSRRHNDANVLCLSADLLGQKLIEKILHIWLTTEFEGGRHARRVRKISVIESGADPTTIATHAESQ